MITNEEAISIVKYVFNWYEDNARTDDNQDWSKQYEALNKAVAALRHECPKKVDVHSWMRTVCPACGHELSKHHGDGYYSIPARMTRCCDCGQMLDWGDKDDDR